MQRSPVWGTEILETSGERHVMLGEMHVTPGEVLDEPIGTDMADLEAD
jgi:hypothetical protein